MKDHLAALAVINRAAVQISADRHAHHQRRGEPVVRAPAQRRELVANLHHRGPDVIEKLDLDHRLHPARGHADRAPDDGGFGQRRVEAARGAEHDLQSLRRLEHAALAFDLLETGFAAAIGDVLAEHDDALVAAHLFMQREIDGVDHRPRLARKMRLGFEFARSGIDASE